MTVQVHVLLLFPTQSCDYMTCVHVILVRPILQTEFPHSLREDHLVVPDLPPLLEVLEGGMVVRVEQLQAEADGCNYGKGGGGGGGYRGTSGMVAAEGGSGTTTTRSSHFG